MDMLETIISILSGIIVLIPLMRKLIVVVKENARQKNWPNLMNWVMELMQEAEVKFNDGATKKAYVIAVIQTSARFADYEVDINTVSKMIDSMCSMSKVVNAPAEAVSE
jgi:hypothetical protein